MLKTDTPDLTDAAQDAAHAAAAYAGVEVHPLTAINEMVAAAALIDAIWKTSGHLPVDLQKAVAHADSYLCGAVRDGELVGVLIGFLGFRDSSVILRSHVAGVKAGTQGRNVGFALKQHQRAWALVHGVRRIIWTFDPLVRRNAYFNLSKLAAAGVGYELNFYGAMGDGINGGDETDRVVIDWWLDDPAVTAAAAGQPRLVDVKTLRADGAAVLLAVGRDEEPVSGSDAAEVLLCQVPEDILALRADPRRRPLAYRWRTAIRETLGHAITHGYQATGMSRDGWYVLTHPGQR